MDGQSWGRLSPQHTITRTDKEPHDILVYKGGPAEPREEIVPMWLVENGSVCERVNQSSHTSQWEAPIYRLRALIVGSSRTPSENVIFTFDIFKSDQYPEHPAYVRFLRHGRKLNSNFPKTARFVSASLEGGNSNAGSRNLPWVRNQSAVRALVFMDEPYYETGLRKQCGTVGGQISSIKWTVETLSSQGRNPS